LPPAYNILDGQPNPQQQQDGQAPPPSYEEALNANPYPGYQPNIFPKPTSQPPQNIVYPHYNATGGNAAPAASIYAPGRKKIQNEKPQK
jgi:hypothetical protein